jgi:hypothetical protein
MVYVLSARCSALICVISLVRAKWRGEKERQNGVEVEFHVLSFRIIPPWNGETEQSQPTRRRGNHQRREPPK